MTSLREAFPILSRVAYLNAGTDGPMAEAARTAARAALDAQAEEGRFLPHFEARLSGQSALRAGYAALLGCDVHEVALMTSTSEGCAKVLAGLDLGPDDEILTSDQEHPGLIGPLLAARDRGARIRTAPLASLAAAVTGDTTLVACSHVGWITGEVADPGLRDVGIPVVFDGAQGIGAIQIDVRELGCAAYAGAGQKWLCGADGTGMLYVEPGFGARLRAIAPAYMAFENPNRFLDSTLHADARRNDTASLPREGVALSLAALGVLDAAGWDTVLSDGPALAAALVARLQERGRTVAPRGDTTLVSWEEGDPLATRGRMLEAGVIVRDLPGTRYVRASVGAWNDEGDLERLISALP